MVNDLAGRRALVCGASRGIGRATALALAGLGAEVLALARDRDRLEALLPELRARGASAAHAVVADLDDRDALEATVADRVATHGAIHVVVINTAGPPGGLLLDAQEPAFEEAFGRHLLAPHRIVRQVLPGMKAAGYGRFIQVLSTSVREPIPNLGVSNMMRAAAAAWAKTLSRELPPGVTINNVLPGYTETDRLVEIGRAASARTGRTVDEIRAGWKAETPEGRLASPDEIAAAIAFLASPAAAFVRGATLPVDGGRLKGI